VVRRWWRARREAPVARTSERQRWAGGTGLPPPKGAFTHCGRSEAMRVDVEREEPLLPLREKVSPKATDEGLAPPKSLERGRRTRGVLAHAIAALRAGPLIRPASPATFSRKGRRERAPRAEIRECRRQGGRGLEGEG
jgi:hypothetical protein